MNREQVINWYSKALVKLNATYYDIRKGFGEETARKVIDTKLDKLNEMRDLRLLNTNK